MATTKKTSGNKNGRKQEQPELVQAPLPEVPVEDWGTDLTPQPEKAVPLEEATQQAQDEWGQPLVEEEPSQSGMDWGTAPEPTLSQVVIQQHTGTFDPDIVKMMLYGESGSGKTRLTATFPEVLFADIDMGMASVTLPVARAPIYNWKQLEELYAFLAGSREADQYSTVAIDTVNEMQRLAMGMTIEEFQHVKRSYGNLPSQSDYGKMLHDMIELSRQFIMLPKRVVLLAQVISKQFDTDVLQPQLVGKSTARELERKMDVIGYTFKEAGEGEKQKLAVTFDAVDFVTKDRSYKLPAHISEPSWAKIAQYWS